MKNIVIPAKAGIQTAAQAAVIGAIAPMLCGDCAKPPLFIARPPPLRGGRLTAMDSRFRGNDGSCDGS